MVAPIKGMLIAFAVRPGLPAFSTKAESCPLKAKKGEAWVAEL
jgi:hypothetical protein